jgi:lysyl-tRNA synthetase, class II
MPEGENQVIDDRYHTLRAIIAQGINPYPSRSNRTITVAQLTAKFDELQGIDHALTGRIRAIRLHGKSAFVDLEDETGRFQLFFRADGLGADQFAFFKQSIDIGDIIQASGRLFVTKRNEQSLDVTAFTLLSKSLRPLPEKWQGLKDVEKRYRRRYVDLIMNPDVRELFRTRSRLVSEIRHHLEAHQFLEVETPVLQTIAGGATARPFVTHINAYDLDLYLRVAPELFLKRLIVGGFEKVYEIGRSFRNEGVDYSHNPEYTSCEFYWAYQDYEGLMTFTEEMISTIIQKVVGSLKIQHGEHTIDFSAPWKRISITEAIEEKTGINVLELKDEEKLAARIREAGFAAEKGAGYLKLVDDLFKDSVRKDIIQPTIIMDHPVEMEPLAKKSERNPLVVERFQPVVMGQELLKAYTELNDPVEQLERFREQQALRERGDEEAQFVDMDFVEALEYGMPPTAGWGMGIDRFVALVTGAHALREVILFPLVKPKGMEAAGASSQDVVAIDEPGITREEAVSLVSSRLTNKNLVNHSLAVGYIMSGLGKHFGVTGDAWEIAGVVHDLDYEDTMNTPEQHGLMTASELEALGVHAHIVQAVRAHNEKNGTPRESLLDKALFAADPVSGFIVACALVQPSKKLADVSVESLLKKFKNKGFAKGANRDAIASCEAIGLSLEEFLTLSLDALSAHAKELGL